VNPNQLTIEHVQEILLKEKYVCDRALATVVYLSLVMGKPLLLEEKPESVKPRSLKF
jgi:MoxR-like ATPase